MAAEAAGSAISEFLAKLDVRRLNVAGPRASRHPQAYAYAYTVIKAILSDGK